MKADLTRGDRPDGKRGKRYRRVLLQEGRPLLDSDWCAAAEATDAELRRLSRELGCPAGGVGHGFLVTPGPLVALFDEADSFSADGADFRAWRDYGRKLLDRFPSLYLGATAGAGGVDVPGRLELERAAFPTLRIWARMDVGVNLAVEVEGVAVATVAGTDPGSFVAYDVDLSAQAFDTYRELRFELAAGPDQEAWIGLVEGLQPAGTDPALWAARGGFHLDGLTLSLDADGAYPAVSLPAGLGELPPAMVDLASGGPARFAAYLEGGERHVTAVEDPGLLEQALGGTLDTATRTAALPQVKLVPADGLDAAAVEAAFAQVVPSESRLALKAALGTQKKDPCALPEAGGYTGDTNRLYWIEVHAGGPLGTAVVKWSRENASELFAVLETANAGQLVTLPPGPELFDGDLVEVLHEGLELGDAAPAELAGGAFTPPARRAGRLLVVERVEGTTPATGLQLRLFEYDLAGELVATDVAAEEAAAGPEGLKLRRWHGRIETGAPDPNGRFEAALEDGLVVELFTATPGASFRAGDSWQLEVRKVVQNAGGDWREEPHGPERLFAPLALLDFSAPADPLTLVAWLGERFGPLCELEADDVAYDGSAVGSSSDTVQEAIDELYRRDGGGCCHASLDPGAAGVDDAQRIADLIQAELVDGGVVCLRPGIYRFQSPLQVDGLPIELRGCPEATIVLELDGAAGLIAGEGARLELSNVNLVADSTRTLDALVHLQGSDCRLAARECGLFQGGGPATAAAVRVGAVTADLPPPEDYGFYEADPGSIEPSPVPPRSVSLTDCLVMGRWGLAAASLRALELQGCAVYCDQGGVFGSTLRRLEVRGSHCDTAVTPALLAQVSDGDPLEIGERAAQALESVAPGAVGSGPALFAGGLFGGRVHDSGWSGSYGIWCGFARDLDLAGNRYRASAAAVRLDNALEVRVTGERVEGAAIGVHVPLAAVELAVEGCQLAAERGVVLAADAADDPQASPDGRVLLDVRVGGNGIEADTVGIQLGRGDALPEVHLVRAVALEENRVRAGAEGTGILASFVLNPDNPGQNAVDVAHNRIRESRTAILLLGEGYRVLGNRITLGEEAELNLGIRLDDAVDSAVVDNAIEPEGNPSGEQIGISIQGGSGVRVAGNSLWRLWGQTAVQVTGGWGLVLTGNVIQGDCRISTATDTVARGNRLQYGDLVALSCTRGVVSENRCSGALDVLSASGEWQVEDNRVSGALRVRPRTQTQWQFEVGEVFDPGGGFVEAHPFVPPDVPVYEVLGDGGPQFALDGASAAFVNAGFGGPAPGEKYAPMLGKLGLPPAPAAGADAPPPILLSKSSTGPKAAEQPFELGLESAVGNVLGDLAAEVQPGGPAGDLELVPLTFEELVFHVQVLDNWSDELHVGFGPPTGPGHPGVPRAKHHDDSTVQVMDNRVDDLLVVNKYKSTNKIVAHNMAGDTLI